MILGNARVIDTGEIQLVRHVVQVQLQLEMLVDTKDATPDDPMAINIFYKLSQ